MSRANFVWRPSNITEGDVLAFAEEDGVIFVSIAAREKCRIYASTSAGITWAPVSAGLPDSCCVASLALLEKKLFAGTLSNGVWCLDADEWRSLSCGFPVHCEITSLATCGSVLYAASRRHGMFRLSGNGWSPWSEGLPFTSAEFIWVAPSTDELLVSDAINLYRRAPDDSSWMPLSPCLPYGRMPVGIQPNISAGLYAWGAEGVFRSHDGGRSWTSLGDVFWRSRFVRGVVATGGALFAGTIGDGSGGIYRSLDDGSTWEDYSQGLPQPLWSTNLALSGSVLLTGTGASGIWRRSIEELGSGCGTPLFYLHPSKPNPSFGQTHIGFTLNTRCSARLDLLDISHQYIRTLFDEIGGPGRREILLGSDDLAPGIYVYKLSVEGNSQSRHMVLLR